MKLTKAQLVDAVKCLNCCDYVGAPNHLLVLRMRGWVHVGNNSVRCPGQGDDDTNDRGQPDITRSAQRL